MDTAADQSGLSNYKVERELGSGGMGRVSLVISNSTGYRFACKICKIDDPEMRAVFLQELLLWLDLPHHPYLAPCYFFRSMGEGVAIFSEYFEAGSLAIWIVSSRLRSVKELLDVALLTARGLAFLHGLGYVHRDFKPRNVLMEKNGVPRIADFGLAAPGLLLEKSQANVPAGMTEGYRSPEQAAGGPLGSATDMWSWAVSVMETFIGQVTWLDGQVADEVFEDYVNGLPESGEWVMPEALIGVLRRCFQQHPEERWGSMEEVIEVLKPAYAGLSAIAPVTLLPGESFPVPPLRHLDASGEGIGWFSPDWWNELLSASDASAVVSRKPLYLPIGSRNGRALADLIAYGEIEPDLQGLAASHGALRGVLASFYGNKGIIHLALDDASRAIEMFDRAIVIGGELLAQGDRRAADLLLEVYREKAVALNTQGDVRAMARIFEETDTECLESLCLNREALAFFQLGKASYLRRTGRQQEAYGIVDSVVASLEDADSRNWKLLRARYMALEAKVEIANQWGSKTEALALLDRAIAFCSSLLRAASADMDEPVRRTVFVDSVNFRNFRATILISMGRSDEGIEVIRGVLKAFEKLIDSGETQHVSDWAESLGTLAEALRPKQFDEAAQVYDQAIEHLEKLIATQGREELEVALAKTCINKCSLYTNQMDYRSQVHLLDRGIELLERWYTRVSSREISYDLARAYDNRAVVFIAHREYDQALGMCDRVIEIYDAVAAKNDSSDVQGDIAWAHVNRAYVLFFLDRVAECYGELRGSMPVLIREAKRTHRKDFGEQIEKVRKLFGDRDW